MTRSFTFAVILTFFSIAASGENAASTGIYLLKRTKDAGCELKILQIGNNGLKFELSCNRGAPSYNSGAAYGTIDIENNVATYYHQGASDPCQIQFQFQGTTVVVSQNGTDAACGFGWGVYADGTYSLVTRERPMFKYK